ncbi:MAG: hypothetical protein NC489_21295 [Ruminococcus flavefaciens]|nr:hypothetical protein [Ruminococcus flavefaciens]
MQMAAFRARSPYEIGDKVAVVVPAEKNEDGVLYTIENHVITDIACTHYLRSGTVLFTYELDGSGKYAPFMEDRERIQST